MASQIGICNQALAEVGAASITSLDEASVEAVECSRVFDQCLAELLELHEWGFAIRRVLLAEVDNDRLGEWGYAYGAPAGMGTARRVLPNVTEDDGFTATGPYLHQSWVEYGPIPFLIENGVIYCNVEEAVLEYGVGTVEAGDLPATLARALALEIASRIAMPIKKSRELKGDLIKQAEVAKQRAVADDMNRAPRKHPDYVSEAAFARGIVDLDQPLRFRCA